MTEDILEEWLFRFLHRPSLTQLQSAKARIPILVKWAFLKRYKLQHLTSLIDQQNRFFRNEAPL